MKKYQLIFTVSVLGTILFPQVSQAYWWNPFSWSAQPAKLTQQVSVASTSSSTPSNFPQKTIEKVITRTVQVDNPALQIQINQLAAQNADLQSKLSGLTQQLNLCRGSVADLKTKTAAIPSPSPAPITADTRTQVEKITDLNSNIMPILNAIQSDINNYAPGPYPASIFQIAKVNDLLNQYKALDNKFNYGYLVDDYTNPLYQQYTNLVAYMNSYIANFNNTVAKNNVQ